MTSHEFLSGMALGVVAGACLGMSAKSHERKIRRVINRTARNVENAFDNMTH